MDANQILNKIGLFAPMLKKTTPREVKREMVQAFLSSIFTNADAGLVARLHQRISNSDARNMFVLLQDPDFLADLERMTSPKADAAPKPLNVVVGCPHCGLAFSAIVPS